VDEHLKALHPNDFESFQALDYRQKIKYLKSKQDLIPRKDLDQNNVRLGMEGITQSFDVFDSA